MNNAIDVWIPPAEHDLTFTNLDYTGSPDPLRLRRHRPGTYNITISNSAFHDTPQAAINIAQHADHDWTVTNSTFTHTGDSAIFIWGSNTTISHCTITDTGWNPAITWGTHGIYDKGPDNTIADNDISNDSRGQAISIRFHGARVYGNTIHDTAYGIAFFDYDTTTGPQGTSYIYDNRLWNITGYGFYYSNQTDPQGNPPTVNFVLASQHLHLQQLHRSRQRLRSPRRRQHHPRQQHLHRQLRQRLPRLQHLHRKQQRLVRRTQQHPEWQGRQARQPGAVRRPAAVGSRELTRSRCRHRRSSAGSPTRPSATEASCTTAARARTWAPSRRFRPP